MNDFTHIRWFGESWGAPVCHPDWHVEIPFVLPGETGKTVSCVSCGKPIQPIDRGIATYAGGLNVDDPDLFVVQVDDPDHPGAPRGVPLCAYHLDCFSRTVLNETKFERVNPSVRQG